ncbi:flagellar filament capping protein FliD [Paraburkholderia sp. DD10]|jgi:flagellar hook-associated protein 2|uniref:Flagellar hook-associated protein 2 n=1 Tax=Paraburkholderia terricola TaxID=169427 RepID=A0A1M6LGD6_9BURK|nr:MULTISPECIES: flagellar filament capping protein FliD [Paraburkholderia]MDR6492928.1 flagellar hook-associated protein 2 [Paraburkholderia terricola]SDN86293.1 flagellar hook-associated protein 2 [Paraburkholderia sediminicola]SHJ70236.1 flagellar hook-associated protein 2 [Paraburkholderia terricola]
MSTISTSSATASANAALQSAAQSIISGSTGNSSMDVSSLVTALVNAKTAGQTATLAAQQSKDNTTLSAYGALSSALAALQSGVTNLANGTTLSSFAATASGTGLTATAGVGAVAGTYSVAVTQIASSQALSSAAFGTSAQLGTGTLSIALGGKSMDISIDNTNNTLSGIASAINASSNNPGVTATIVTGTDGAHLVLRAANTGASNVINVSTSNVTSDNGLSSLGVTSTASTTGGQSSIVSANAGSAWTQSGYAQDAQFTVGGIAASSSSNAVTGAISGVTINLAAASAGTTQTLTIAQDTASQNTAITNFVSLYNTVIATMATLTSYNAGSSQQGALLGDSTLQTIKNTLATIIGGAVGSGSTGATLAAIGITLKDDPADGTLVVDNNKLNTALTSSPATVATLFNTTNGIAEQLNTSITNFTKTGGIIDTRKTALNADLKSITTQQTALADYTTQLTDQYQAQFTALNTLMATMNNNSAYLTALFGGKDSAGAMATNKS